MAEVVMMRTVCLLLTSSVLVVSYTKEELKQHSDEYVMTTFITPDNLNAKWLGYHLICSGIFQTPGFIVVGESLSCYSNADDWLKKEHLCDKNFGSTMGFIYRDTLSQQGYDVDVFWYLTLLGVKRLEESEICRLLARTEGGDVSFPRPGCKEGPCQYTLKDIQEYHLSSLQRERVRIFVDEMHSRIWGPWDIEHLEGRYQYDMVTLTIYSKTKLFTMDSKVEQAIKQLKTKIKTYRQDPERLAEHLFGMFLNYRKDMKEIFQKDLEAAGDEERKTKIRGHLELYEAMTAMMMRGWFIATEEEVSPTLSLERAGGGRWQFTLPQVPLVD